MAGPRYGFDAAVLAGKETTWGTAVARTAAIEPATMGGGLVPGRFEIPSIRSRVMLAMTANGEKTLGNFSGAVTYEKWLLFLRNTLWGYAFSTPESGRNQHLFTLGTTVPSPLTIEFANTEANAEIFAGCFIRKLAFSAKADAVMECAVDFVGKDPAAATKTASPTFCPLDTLSVVPTQIAVTLDGGSTEELDNIDITIEPGIDEGRAKIRGGADIVQPQPTGKAKITASFSRDYVSAGMQTKFASGASVSLILTATGTTLVTGTYLFKIELPKMIVMGQPPQPGGSGIVSETIDLESILDTSAVTSCRITVHNTEATL